MAGSDGSLVQVAHGALAAPSSVSIAPISQANLPIAVPSWLNFAGAVNLQVGSGQLATPVQLAIPMPGVPAGTTIFIYEAGSLPDDQGIEQPIWLQVDDGVVGTDGFMHTTSPPFGGVDQSSVLFFGEALSASGIALIGLSTLALSPLGGVLLAGLGFAFEAGGVGILVKSALSGAINLPFGNNSYEAFAIPKSKPPLPTTGQIDVTAATTDLDVVVVPPTDMPDPVIDTLSLTYVGNTPYLVIDGTGFGDPADDVVRFDRNDGTPDISVPADPTRSTSTELQVPINASVTLGLATISVSETFTDEAGDPWTVDSDPTSYQPASVYEFTAQPTANAVSVIDEDPNTSTFNQLIHTISLDGIVPTSLAPTHDNTRIFVIGKDPKTGLGVITIIDGVDLQQLDTGSLEKFDGVSGPAGGIPSSIGLGENVHFSQITIDPNDQYAYISDQLAGRVYVLDINPQSPTYLNYRVISLNAPDGLAGLAVSNDDKYLVVAAPNRKSYFAAPDSPEGTIWQITIDPSLSSWSTFWQSGQPLPSFAIPVGDYPYGVTASPYPNEVAFTDMLDDDKGVGILNMSQHKVEYYIPFTLSRSINGQPSVPSSFNVSGAQQIVFSPTGTYAFVTSYAVPQALFYNPDNPTIGNPSRATGSDTTTRTSRAAMSPSSRIR